MVQAVYDLLQRTLRKNSVSGNANLLRNTCSFNYNMTKFVNKVNFYKKYS